MWESTWAVGGGGGGGREAEEREKEGRSTGKEYSWKIIVIFQFQF